ncbi:FAD-dependent oxidoreductase [Rhizobium sp. CC-YZS058]|uniref:FAD-dependent oxidoreductase n=1 Tax=Rhizobium sp. CC-YZS058 TaxID=3042153 RepID=UPI002B059675|nr:FAD-dependent oxidoreductase [Rhizobium sp. CC-YZS058]MEA3537283.1 FAD-dependent oxidoreductase [Rhizobium sp. CC-YZS058]
MPETLRAKILAGDSAVSDRRNDLRYFHYDIDHQLVSGGTHTAWMGEAARGRAKVARMLDKAFAAFDGPPEMAEYWHGTFAFVPDRRPRLYRLAPRLVFGGIYSGRGVALALSLGQEIGRWAAGRRLNTDMPLPVTAMKPSPFHPVAVAFANRTETGSTGSLRPDFDPKFLSLMLKTNSCRWGPFWSCCVEGWFRRSASRSARHSRVRRAR